MRSGKHDSSTIYTNGRYFDHLLGLKKFDKVIKHESAVKPIGIFFVMEIQIKPHDFQKHRTLPCRNLKNTIWMCYLSQHTHQVCQLIIK